MPIVLLAHSRGMWCAANKATAALDSPASCVRACAVKRSLRSHVVQIRSAAPGVRTVAILLGSAQVATRRLCGMLQRRTAPRTFHSCSHRGSFVWQPWPYNWGMRS